MNAKGHLICGFVLSLSVLFLLSYFNTLNFNLKIENIILLLLIISFYSLLPDIDHGNSKMTEYFLIIGFIALVISVIQLTTELKLANDTTLLLVFSTIVLSISILGPKIFCHRGIIHSLFVGILSAIPIYILFHNLIFTITAFVSYYSHLLADGYVFKLK